MKRQIPGFNVGGEFMVRTCQLIEISLKMRNRFPGHLRGGRTKGPAQSPKLGAEFIFHLFGNVYLCYLASVQRKRIGYRCFNFPPMMKRYIDSGESWNLDHIVTPLTPLAPCHKDLVYGAHLKYIIERSEKKRRKKHISIINTREWKEHISSHIECTFILRSFNRVQFFSPLIIYRPDRARWDKSVDLIDLAH